MVIHVMGLVGLVIPNIQYLYSAIFIVFYLDFHHTYARSCPSCTTPPSLGLISPSEHENLLFTAFLQPKDTSHP